MISRYFKKNVISMLNLPVSFKCDICNIPTKIIDGKTVKNARKLFTVALLVCLTTSSSEQYEVIVNCYSNCLCFLSYINL